MIMFKIIGILAECFVFIYVGIDIILAVRNAKYQKLWRLKKSTLLRIDPAITRAKLCERYVEFCKVNACKVEF